MRIAFLSDLHLSPKGPSCAFDLTPSIFSTFLDEVEREADHVVVVGDLFDASVTPGLRGRLRRAREAWPDVVQRLMKTRPSLVFGNHDAQLARDGVPEVWCLEADNVQIVAMHGHQFERRPWLWDQTKNRVKGVAAWLQRSGLGDLGDAMYALNRWTAHPTQEGLSAMDQRALDWVRARDEEGASHVDVLVYGHTHRPLVERDPYTGTVLLNTGACSFGRWDWACVNTETRSATLYDRIAGSERSVVF